MKPDTGEPPSPGTQFAPASPVSSPHPSDLPVKVWRPANFWTSFRHAGDGVCETFRAERNFRVHCVLVVVVVATALLLHLSPLRIVALVLAAGFVLMAELFNTAIEATVDLAMPEHHPLAKRAKDAAAGAVLMSAGTAVLVGAFVFLPVIVLLLARVAVPPSLLYTILGAVFGVAVLAAWLGRRRRNPSTHTPESSGTSEPSRSGTSTELSRKLVIGVMLAAFVAASTYQTQTQFRKVADPAEEICGFGGCLEPKPVVGSVLREDLARPSLAGVR